MTQIPQRNDELWAITSYFNPVGYKRRLANYRAFRQRFPLPLVAVELSFDGRFQLCEDDAEVLIHLRGQDIIWQKEKLLEIALQAVPAACHKVMWVDCDVIFEHGDWPEKVYQSLEDLPFLQPFNEIYDLVPDNLPEDGGEAILGSAHSFGAAVGGETGTQESNIFRFRPQFAGQRVAPAAGFAWCFRRELLEDHGLYSGGILGGNDRAMACAACGQFEDAIRNWLMNERQRQHYLEWAEPFYATVRSRVGFISNKIYHLWHGELKHRRYRERHEGLTRFGFDPYKDITPDEHGCWRWNSKKPELHTYVRNHFFKRQEGELFGTSTPEPLS